MTNQTRRNFIGTAIVAAITGPACVKSALAGDGIALTSIAHPTPVTYWMSPSGFWVFTAEGIKELSENVLTDYELCFDNWNKSGLKLK
jgi:hypothetical protein